MIKEYKIIDNIIKKTKDNQILWFGIGKNISANFYSKIKITGTKKIIRFDIKSEFKKGKYYKVLKITYYNGVYYNTLKTLFVTKYNQISNLEKLVREKSR